MMKKLLITLTTLTLTATVQAEVGTPLSLKYTPYTDRDGFTSHAFCADTVLQRGQSVAIDVRLPQKDPNTETHQTYGLMIFPAVKVRLTNPRGEVLEMERFGNRFKSLSPKSNLVAPVQYENNPVYIDPLYLYSGHRELQYAHHEGIYRLTALENEAVKICVRNEGFSTKLQDRQYPTTRLSDYTASP